MRAGVLLLAVAVFSASYAHEIGLVDSVTLWKLGSFALFAVWIFTVVTVPWNAYFLLRSMRLEAAARLARVSAWNTAYGDASHTAPSASSAATPDWPDSVLPSVSGRASSSAFSQPSMPPRKQASSLASFLTSAVDPAAVQHGRSYVEVLRRLERLLLMCSVGAHLISGLGSYGLLVWAETALPPLAASMPSSVAWLFVYSLVLRPIWHLQSGGADHGHEAGDAVAFGLDTCLTPSVGPTTPAPLTRALLSSLDDVQAMLQSQHDEVTTMAKTVQGDLRHLRTAVRRVTERDRSPLPPASTVPPAAAASSPAAPAIDAGVPDAPGNESPVKSSLVRLLGSGARYVLSGA